MTMREGESVKAYVERYWEMFNEIDGDFDEVAIRTFKVGLPSEHGLRKSLTGKPISSLRKLIDRVDKYKRIENDQQQEKGKAKVVIQERKDFRSDRYNNNQPRRDYVEQLGSNNNQVIGAIFRDPTRWWEILKSETETSIVNTIEIIVIQQRIAEAYGITWTNLFEKTN